MTSITALFNQKQSKCYVCSYFTYNVIISSQQRPLQINLLTDPEELLLLTLSHTQHIILSQIKYRDPLIGTYRYHFSYRADADIYIKSHYRPIPISVR